MDNRAYVGGFQLITLSSAANGLLFSDSLVTLQVSGCDPSPEFWALAVDGSSTVTMSLITVRAGNVSTSEVLRTTDSNVGSAVVVSNAFALQEITVEIDDGADKRYRVLEFYFYYDGGCQFHSGKVRNFIS